MRMRLLAAACMASSLVADIAAPAHAEDARSGGISVSAPWIRATPGGAKVAGAYLELRADPGTDDKLIAVQSPAAAVVEMHTHIEDKGVLRMRRVDAIPVSGEKPVTLEPGGYHLMLMDLTSPLKEGESVEITLTFEKAGALKVKAAVAGIGAQTNPNTATEKPSAGAGSPSRGGSGSGSSH